MTLPDTGANAPVPSSRRQAHGRPNDKGRQRCLAGSVPQPPSPREQTQKRTPKPDPKPRHRPEPSMRHGKIKSQLWLRRSRRSSKRLRSNSSTTISGPKKQRRLYPQTLQPIRAIIVLKTTSKNSNVFPNPIASSQEETEPTALPPQPPPYRARTPSPAIQAHAEGWAPALHGLGTRRTEVIPPSATESGPAEPATPLPPPPYAPPQERRNPTGRRSTIHK